MYVYIYIYSQRRTKSETVPIHDIKVGRRNGGTNPLILNSAIGEDEWSPSRPCSFILRKEPIYPLNRRLGASQRVLDGFGEEKQFSPLGN